MPENGILYWRTVLFKINFGNVTACTCLKRVCELNILLLYDCRSFLNITGAIKKLFRSLSKLINYESRKKRENLRGLPRSAKGDKKCEYIKLKRIWRCHQITMKFCWEVCCMVASCFLPHTRIYTRPRNALLVGFD